MGESDFDFDDSDFDDLDLPGPPERRKRRFLPGAGLKASALLKAPPVIDVMTAMIIKRKRFRVMVTLPWSPEKR